MRIPRSHARACAADRANATPSAVTPFLALHGPKSRPLPLEMRIRAFRGKPSMRRSIVLVQSLLCLFSAACAASESADLGEATREATGEGDATRVRDGFGADGPTFAHGGTAPARVAIDRHASSPIAPPSLDGGGGGEGGGPPPPQLVLRAGLLGGPGSLDGTGASARFSYPYSVAVDSAGAVYVADQGNEVIRKITPEGVVTTIAGVALVRGSADGPAADARFALPSGIVVDANDNVFVADSFNQTIRKITPSGMVTTVAGKVEEMGSADGALGVSTFAYPSAVAVDADGNVFVADAFNSTIRKLTPEGIVSTFAGTAGAYASADGTGSAARFMFPEGVAVDGAGNVYVGDTGNETIRKITPSGVVTTLAGSAGNAGSDDGTGSAARFSHPGGLVADGVGNVYFGDTYNQTVRKVTAAGVSSTLAGEVGVVGSSDGTAVAAHFSDPKGTAIDAFGNVFVADYGSNTIRKIAPGGVVTTLAGAAPAAGSADGVGTAARFDLPSSYYASGLALDAAGSVFVADTNNHTIRKVTSAGVATTFAGSAGQSGNDDGTGGDARFSSPTGVASDASGNLFVADMSNSTIRKITSAGVVTTFAGTAGMSGRADGTGAAARFFRPKAIATDADGNLFVADRVSPWGSGLIRKVTADGIVTTLAGDPNGYGLLDGTGAAARFGDPAGIAVDAAGNVFVTESQHHTIRRVTPTGEVTTIAGTAGSSGNVDGTGAEARFDRPTSITVDVSGNLYVADANNNTIRKITPAGVVTTVVGAPRSVGVKLGALPGSLGALSGVTITPAGNLVVAAENAILDVLLH